MTLNLGKHKKLWNKGFDGIVVGHSHERGTECSEEKWSGTVLQWIRCIGVFGEVHLALNLGKHKKLWNKGFVGIVVGCSHESGSEHSECEI